MQLLVATATPDSGAPRFCHQTPTWMPDIDTQYWMLNFIATAAGLLSVMQDKTAYGWKPLLPPPHFWTLSLILPLDHLANTLPNHPADASTDAPTPMLNSLCRKQLLIAVTRGHHLVMLLLLLQQLSPKSAAVLPKIAEAGEAGHST